MLRAASLFAVLTLSGCQAILGLSDTTSRADAAVTSVADATSRVDASGAASFDVQAPSTTAWVVRGGATVTVTVFITRHAGFTGPVTLTADGLPSGVSGGGSIPDGMTMGSLTLTATASAAPLGPHTFQLSGSHDGETHSAPAQLTLADPPGSVDTTFNGGVVRLAVFDQSASAGVVIDARGDIVVGLSGSSGLESYMAVARLLGDGTPDPGFGNNGVVVGPAASTMALAIGGDGKLVVAGNRNGVTVIARLLDSGKPDTGFAGATASDAGVASGSFVDGRGITTAIGVQSTGKLVYTSRAVGNSAAPRICRLALDGSGVDSSFGVAGCVDLFSGGVFLTTMRIDHSDDIFASGYSTVVDAGTAAPLFVHLDPGALSTTRAVVYSSIPCSVDAAAIVPDGTGLYMVGSCGGDAMAMRGDESRLDDTFGATIVLTAIGAAASSANHAVAVQADGQVLLGGVYTAASLRPFDHFAAMHQGGFVTRVGANGVIDLGFGSDHTGYVRPNDGNGQAVVVTDLAVQSDGRIVVVGEDDSGVVIIRLWP